MSHRLGGGSWSRRWTTLALAGSALAVGGCTVAGLDVATGPAHAGAAAVPSAAAVTEAEALAIGIEAHQFFYPLISMEITRRVTTNLPDGIKPGMGRMNAFHHMQAFPTADFREVVRPNFDTLYSIAWADITKEPQIVSAPDTQGRYYMLPMVDMWSNVFAVPGKRTSGTQAAHWALVAPDWRGELPAGVQRIDAPTPYVWIIGRTQTNGPADYPAVHAVQAGYRLTPLSQWGKSYEAPAATLDATFDMKTPPLVQVNTMPAARYYALGVELMTLHRPQLTDWSILARMARIGLVPGRPFDFAKAPPAVQAGLARAPAASLAAMQAKLPTLAKVVDGWQMNVETMGVYGNSYLKRALVAMFGLGANPPEDAVYPLNIADADGAPLVGEHRYELHFPAAQLPPVGAFWSVTMYDAEGFQVANAIDRFAIGDRDQLQYAADGSLTIYIQHQSPGAERESNWLPAPASGKLGVTMRLYAPQPQVLDGRWNPPAIRRVD